MTRSEEIIKTAFIGLFLGALVGIIFWACETIFLAVRNNL